MKITDFLHQNHVAFLDVKNRNDCVSALVDLLYEQKVIQEKEEFFQAVVEREKIVTTGIGMGVAIPHAKLSNYDDFFVAIGILKTGIDWGALDGTKVRVVFLIGGPDDKQTEYLQILSGITVALKDEERRKKILKAENPEQVLDVFEGF